MSDVRTTTSKAATGRRAGARIRGGLLAGALALLGPLAVAQAAAAASAAAAPPPTTAPPSTPFDQCPAIGIDTSCALLIYVDPSGTPSVIGDPSQSPFDGGDDTLVGVQNDSSQPITSMPVSATSGKPLFGFDGDGLCTFTFTGSAACPFGPTGYEGPGTSFADISQDQTSGVVQFSPPIPPGGHTYFSLEDALSTVPPYDLSSGITYVALGDSYSSGEGNPPFGWSSSSSAPNNHCDRSSFAYGPELDALASLGPIAFVACSGAITDDLFAPNHEGNLRPNDELEPAQLCGAAGAQACPAGTTPWLDAATKTVTLTIGGNDVGFKEVLEHCVKGSFGPISFNNGNCLREPKLAQQVYARIAALSGSGKATTPAGRPIHPLASVLRAIHQVAPNAHVYIAGYPLLFPLDPHASGNCKVGTIHVNNLHVFGGDHDATISFPDQFSLDLTGLALDEVIGDAARSVGSWATFVDPVARFDEHTFCGSGSLWFNELFSEYDFSTHKVTYTASGSFHPNAGGQLLGYTEAFLQAGA